MKSILDLTKAQILAAIKKLGGYEGTVRFLCGEIEILVTEHEKKWRE